MKVPMAVMAVETRGARAEGMHGVPEMMQLLRRLLRLRLLHLRPTIGMPMPILRGKALAGLPQHALEVAHIKQHPSTAGTDHTQSLPTLLFQIDWILLMEAHHVLHQVSVAPVWRPP